MPQPRRPKLRPEELASEIARRLAESEPVGKGRSIRDSVAIGRLIAGTVMAGTVFALVIAVFASVSWIMARSPTVEPEVLSANVEGTDTDISGFGSTTPGELESESVATTTVLEPEVPASAAITGITLPEPATPDAPIAITQTTGGPTTSSPASAPTTMAPTTTTSTTRPVVTTSTMTSPTTTVVMTSTTEPVTTTTGVVTTTTIMGSTTTCGNQGQGKGNC